MRLWVVHEEMKKKHVPKNDFFPIVMTLANGIQKIKDQNYGTYSMVKRNSVNTFVFFQLVIGPKWIFGNILKKENIELPSLYFSHEREVIKRGNTILANSPFITLKPNEKVTKEIVRFRTIGDLTITGAVESEASTLDHIIAEVAAARETERGNRADDQRSEAAMEERKKEGYF